MTRTALGLPRPSARWKFPGAGKEARAALDAIEAVLARVRERRA